jgi:WD40 repeat protein
MHQSPSSNDGQENNEVMNNYIMSELLGYSQRTVPSRHSEGSAVINSPPSVFSYKQKASPSVDPDPTPTPLHGINSSSSSTRRQSEPIKSARKIKRLPSKVLDAPALQDDFYLNLVDWSYRNTLAVGLGASVYLWAASTAKIQQLCDLGEGDSVSSVTWMYEGSHLAVGTNLGRTLIYDVTTKKQLAELAPHAARVGSMAWCGFSSSTGVVPGYSSSPSSSTPDTSTNGMPNGFGGAFASNNNNPIGTGSCSGLLATGSRDKHIFLHDPRIRSYYKHSSSDPVVASGVTTPRSSGTGSSGSGSGSGKSLYGAQLRQQTAVPMFPSMSLPEEEFDFDLPFAGTPLFPPAGFRSPTRSLSTPVDDDMELEMYSSPSRRPVRTDPDSDDDVFGSSAANDPMIMSVDDFADETSARPPSFPRSGSVTSQLDASSAAMAMDPTWDLFDDDLDIVGGRFSAPADIGSGSRFQRSGMDAPSPFSTPSRSSYPMPHSRSAGARGQRSSDSAVYSRYPSFTPPRPAGTPTSRHSSPAASPWAAASARAGSSPGASRAGGGSGPRAPSNTAPPSPPPTVAQQRGVVSVLSQHRQEVCGLKWSFDGSHLASGGNDNKLCVWAPMHGSGSRPVHHFADHTAAVKAIAWSPHQHHILASGGGTADRHIRFWNTATGAALQKVDTGSQVRLRPFMHMLYVIFNFCLIFLISQYFIIISASGL